MSTGANLIRLLKGYGVDVVFGIPGVHTLELYRALAPSGLRHITARHEQGAGFMADGYARTSGKPGVCLVISGPGMTNIITAMGQAFSDSVPMLIISTVNAHGRMGSGEGWLHELTDQQALIRGVCAFSHTVHDAAELPTVLARAFAVFNGGRARPVHIEIPVNVLNDTTADIKVPLVISTLQRPTATVQQLQQAAQLIVQAKAPLILAGGGAIHAAESIRELAQHVGAPVVMSINARGILPSTHPLAVGASASLTTVRALIETADVVLALGTELGSTDYDFNEDEHFTIPGKLIRIDIDAQQLVRTRIPEMGIVGDCATTSCDLLALVATQPSHEHAEQHGAQRADDCRHKTLQSLSARDHQYLFVLNSIRDALPEPVIVGDSTQIIYAGNSAFCSNKPAGYFNSATGFGTLGYALPAAIGAAIADPDGPVVSIIGDGGLQFTLPELSTAVDAGVNPILIVHVNGGYAEIKRFMNINDIKPIGVDMLVPDIMAMARACQWKAHQVNSLGEIGRMLLEAVACEQPTLLLMNDEIFD